MSPNRTILSTAVIAGTLLLAVVWSLSYWSDAGDDADRAAADLDATRTLVRQIRSVRPGPPGGTAGPIAADLPKLIDDALKQAEIDPEKLTQVAEQPARRTDAAGVDEHSVRLVFHQISLRQALAVCTRLSATGGVLRVRDFHIAYSADTLGQGWNADIVVSYLTPGSPGQTERGTAPAD